MKPDKMIRVLCTFPAALLVDVDAYAEQVRVASPGLRFGRTDAIRVLLGHVVKQAMPPPKAPGIGTEGGAP